MSRTLINTLAKRGAKHHPMLEEAGCGGSCSTPSPMPARLTFDAPPVKVNGVELSEADIAREAQHHQGASMEEARASAARALIIRHLLLQQACELGLSPAPETDALGRWESDEEALIRQVLEMEAPPAQPTMEECRRVYDARRAVLEMEFAVAEPIIRDRLTARAWMAASAAYVARLMRAASIQGLEVPKEAGP